jgi:hypothetical protein
MKGPFTAEDDKMTACFRLLIGVWVIGVLGCGEDGPTVGGSPCAQEVTRDVSCVSLVLDASDMEYQTHYDDLFGWTEHEGAWSPDGSVIRGYGPGQQIRVSVRFHPPLVVRIRTVPRLTFEAGPEGDTDRRVTVETTVDYAGDWQPFQTYATLNGSAGTGESLFRVSTSFDVLEPGAELSALTWEFTVPDTYDSGAQAGQPILPGDLTVLRVWWGASTDGRSPDEPPVWPGGDPAATP